MTATTVAIEQRIFVLLGVALAGWLLYLLAPIMTPFIAAALLAYIGDPLVDRLERMSLPRSLAVVVVFGMMLLFLVLLGVLVGPLVREQIGAIAAQIPRYLEMIDQRLLPWIGQYVDLPVNDSAGMRALLTDNWERASQYATTVLASVGRSGGALVTALLNTLLIPIITFYMLRDWDGIVRRVGALVPEDKREMTFELARRSDEMLAGFLRGQLLVMLGLATIYTVGLKLLDLDNALAIGVVAGLVSFVPYLGFIVGILLAGFSALVQSGSLLMLVGVVAVFAIGQMIEGTVLTPKLVGDRIGLHPVLVIFAVMAGGQLWGFFGILLALPAAAVVSVLVRYAYTHYRGPRPDSDDGSDGAYASADNDPGASAS